MRIGDGANLSHYHTVNALTGHQRCELSPVTVRPQFMKIELFFRQLRVAAGPRTFHHDRHIGSFGTIRILLGDLQQVRFFHLSFRAFRAHFRSAVTALSSLNHKTQIIRNSSIPHAHTRTVCTDVAKFPQITRKITFLLSTQKKKIQFVTSRTSVTYKVGRRKFSLSFHASQQSLPYFCSHTLNYLCISTCLLFAF